MVKPKQSMPTNVNTPKRPPNAPGHRAGGARAGSGRKSPLDEGQRKRYDHWRAWWPTRPDLTPSAAALARRMNQIGTTVRRYAAGTSTPGPAALLNLESLSAAYGYQPLTTDYLTL